MKTKAFCLIVVFAIPYITNAQQISQDLVAIRGSITTRTVVKDSVVIFQDFRSDTNEQLYRYESALDQMATRLKQEKKSVLQKNFSKVTTMSKTSEGIRSRLYGYKPTAGAEWSSFKQRIEYSLDSLHKAIAEYKIEK